LARALFLVLALAALAAAPLARADADPASDYLLGQATFIPPDDGIPRAYADQLNATVREAKARGYTIRVALIGSRYDMGGVTVLYEKPKQYARFLGQELALIYKQRLLVVMPNGLAVSKNGKLAPREQAVVDRIAPPGPNDGTALASTGTKAVIRLAAASGIVVPEQPLAASGRSAPGSSDTRDRIVIAAAAVAAALLAALVVIYRRRRSAGA
jgi:hypothetical protein